jgi:hypothetical protein
MNQSIQSLITELYMWGQSVSKAVCPCQMPSEFHTLQHVRYPRIAHSIPQGKPIIGSTGNAVIGVTLKHAIQVDSDCASIQMSCSGELGISDTSSHISSDDALARIQSDASKGLVVPSLTVVQSVIILSRSSAHHTVFFLTSHRTPPTSECTFSFRVPLSDDRCSSSLVVIGRVFQVLHLTDVDE